MAILILVRAPWSQLPPHVLAEVEQLLDFPVVRAVSQAGGFSPGVAARVRGPHGERAFVKAASGAVNAESLLMHRREARLTPLLPSSLGSPCLLGTYDDGDWVALVLEEVDGRPPRLPWQEADLTAALAVLDQLAEVPAPAGLPTAVEVLATDFGGWAQLAAGPEPVPSLSGEMTWLSAWEARNLARLAELEQSWPDACAGRSWLHLDVRADNLLLRPDGSAVLVDWPSLGSGNPVLDLVAFAPSAVRDGAPPAQELLRRTNAGRLADPDLVTVLVCAVAGYFQHRRRQPPPAGMPTVRASQAAQGDVALAWLRQRLGEA